MTVGSSTVRGEYVDRHGTQDEVAEGVLGECCQGPQLSHNRLLRCASVVGVGEVDSCGTHLVELLTGPGNGVGKVDDVEDSGSAETGDLHSSHARHATERRSRRRCPSGAHPQR